LGAEEKEKLYT